MGNFAPYAEERLRIVLSEVVGPAIGTDDPAYAAMVVEEALVAIMKVIEEEF